MFQYLVISYLLSCLGFVAYRLGGNKKMTLLQRKRILLSIIGLSLLLPFLSELPGFYIPIEDKMYEQAIERFTQKLNVVDLQDAELKDCYEKAATDHDFCHCDVQQKANIIVFKPDPFYNFIIHYGTAVLWLFTFVSLVLLLDFLLKLGYLIWLSQRSKKELCTFKDTTFYILYPNRKFPISSFRFIDSYIIWSSALNDLSDKEKEAILLHELSHIKRFDTWLQVVLSLLKAIWWLNPVFFLIQRDLNLLSELLADRYAIEETGADARDYASLLVKMKEKQLKNSLVSPLGGSILKQRVLQLLHPEQRPTTGYGKLFLLVVGTLLLSVSAFLVPALEQHTESLREYEIIRHEHDKTGKNYFCKACLLEQLKNKEDLKK